MKRSLPRRIRFDCFVFIWYPCTPLSLAPFFLIPAFESDLSICKLPYKTLWPATPIRDCLMSPMGPSLSPPLSFERFTPWTLSPHPAQA